MLHATYCRYQLEFKEPAVTSRQVMDEKETYFVKIWDTAAPERFGVGECAVFRGLGCDDRPDYEQVLDDACKRVAQLNKLPNIAALNDYPSIRFGLETAINDLKNGGKRLVFPGDWSEGRSKITINGLVWMGSKEQMIARVNEKIEAGFRCIKFKIGGINFDDEVEIIREVRRLHPMNQLEIRLDANGAFTADDALDKLEILSQYSIHSIEQPVKAGQYDLMAKICRKSPIPIALDEELIGVNSLSEKRDVLRKIKPSYIILKPSLCGGFYGSEQWIEVAERLGIRWWGTSALESNIGLNVIAQWLSNHRVTMPQGLGTGGLYTNNIPSPIMQIGESLAYNTALQWQMPKFNWG